MSKARQVTFRVLAIVATLWVGLVVIFGLTEVVLMWLPAETLASTIDFPPEDVVHRAHFMAIGINSWALLLGVLAQLRRPARCEEQPATCTWSSNIGPPPQ